ncbi:hypothetical protein B0H19DRAFT_1238309 [Mycena capillaripes]|nr:hypothetical protein B0H19DRAFT_1238309 [Mycena capillaripes]
MWHGGLTRKLSLWLNFFPEDDSPLGPRLGLSTDTKCTLLDLDGLDDSEAEKAFRGGCGAGGGSEGDAADASRSRTGDPEADGRLGKRRGGAVCQDGPRRWERHVALVVNLLRHAGCRNKSEGARAVRLGRAGPDAVGVLKAGDEFVSCHGERMYACVENDVDGSRRGAHIARAGVMHSERGDPLLRAGCGGVRCTSAKLDDAPPERHSCYALLLSGEADTEVFGLASPPQLGRQERHDFCFPPRTRFLPSLLYRLLFTFALPLSVLAFTLAIPPLLCSPSSSLRCARHFPSLCTAPLLGPSISMPSLLPPPSSFTLLRLPPGPRSCSSSLSHATSLHSLLNTSQPHLATAPRAILARPLQANQAPPTLRPFAGAARRETESSNSGGGGGTGKSGAEVARLAADALLRLMVIYWDIGCLRDRTDIGLSEWTLYGLSTSSRILEWFYPSMNGFCGIGGVLEPRPKAKAKWPNLARRESFVRPGGHVFFFFQIPISAYFVPDLPREGEAGIVFGHDKKREAGSGVTLVKKGDRVIMPFSVACGRCFNYEESKSAFCILSNPGFRIWEYVCVQFANFMALVLPPGTEHDEDFALLADISPSCLSFRRKIHSKLWSKITGIFEFKRGRHVSLNDTADAYAKFHKRIDGYAESLYP